MVKQAFRRLISRFMPEVAERKHLPQLARIEKVYDLPTNTPLISTPFRPLKAVDVQLIDSRTFEALNTPIFEQVTIATGQSNEHGLLNEVAPGMVCLIQYIDGLNSQPVITSILPWQTLVPAHKNNDVALQQNAHSKLFGTNSDWHLNTQGQLKQQSQKQSAKHQSGEFEYHERKTTIAAHDELTVDGNQINEVLGALKTIVGEKALLIALDNLLLGSKKKVEIKSHDHTLLESLKNLTTKAAALNKLQGQTVWVGNDSVNVLQILLDLIEVVKQTNKTLATHSHASGGSGPPQPPTVIIFNGYVTNAEQLKGQLQPIVG